MFYTINNSLNPFTNKFFMLTIILDNYQKCPRLKHPWHLCGNYQTHPLLTPSLNYTSSSKSLEHKSLTVVKDLLNKSVYNHGGRKLLHTEGKTSSYPKPISGRVCKELLFPSCSFIFQNKRPTKYPERKVFRVVQRCHFHSLFMIHALHVWAWPTNRPYILCTGTSSQCSFPVWYTYYVMLRVGASLKALRHKSQRKLWRQW